jgi:hypothetical protein
MSHHWWSPPLVAERGHAHPVRIVAVLSGRRLHWARRADQTVGRGQSGLPSIAHLCLRRAGAPQRWPERRRRNRPTSQPLRPPPMLRHRNVLLRWFATISTTPASYKFLQWFCSSVHHHVDLLRWFTTAVMLFRSPAWLHRDLARWRFILQPYYSCPASQVWLLRWIWGRMLAIEKLREADGDGGRWWKNRGDRGEESR